MVPPSSDPAAATGGLPMRRARTSSSRRASPTSEGSRPTTSPRAVAPSSNLVSSQRCASILRRCDLPLPKKPLTHTASWRGASRCARYRSSIRCSASANRPVQTNVSSSARSSRITLGSVPPVIRAWPLLASLT